MRKSSDKIEILAPAGNMESLKAAVINNADAVYLGLQDFSARAKAANFDLDELYKAIDYAHFFGVKVYIAVNTLIKDNEMSKAVNCICEAIKAGADAFIIQDLGLLMKIRELSDIPLHASTQLGIHNIYGAEAAKKLGFDRIILSREATIEDIKQIREAVDIEIEAFVQGALCVAFSGNCLFSSLVSGYSGNRGKCLQLCRKKYEIEIDGLKDCGYYLSAKDLCFLTQLEKLINAGVSSLKIEGRMRRPEYVGESANIYKNAVNAILNKAKFDFDKSQDALKKLYNRGDYTCGYLFNPTENVIYSKLQGHKGVCIGKVKHVNGKIANLKLNCPLHINDGLKFIGPNGESGGCSVNNLTKITFGGSVAAGDDVYLTSDAKQLDSIIARERKLSLHYDVVLNKDCNPICSATVENVTVTVQTDSMVQAAKTMPISKDNVVEIFNQTASDYFNIESVNVNMDKNVFITIGQLKELRRIAEKNIIKTLREKTYRFTPRKNNSRCTLSDIVRQNFDSLSRLAIADNEMQLYELDNCAYFDALIFSPKDFSDIDSIERVFSNVKKTLFLNTPIIARNKDFNVLKRIAKSDYVKNIVANNLYAVELFKEKNILLGSFMNLLNSTEKVRKIIPYESEKTDKDNYAIAFSYVPVMTFSHCSKRNLYGKCPSDCNGFEGKLIDESGNSFRITHYKIKYCYSQLKNQIPLCLVKELSQCNHEKCIFDFCDCSSDFVADFVSDLMAGKNPIFKHTHFNYTKQLR